MTQTRTTMFAGLRATERLQPGDSCEFRFPARREWHPGVVVENGGGYYWKVRNTKPIPADSPGNRDHPAGEVIASLQIEHVRALGTDPWGEYE